MTRLERIEALLSAGRLLEAIETMKPEIAALDARDEEIRKRHLVTPEQAETERRITRTYWDRFCGYHAGEKIAIGEALKYMDREGVIKRTDGIKRPIQIPRTRAKRYLRQLAREREEHAKARTAQVAEQIANRKRRARSCE